MKPMSSQTDEGVGVDHAGHVEGNGGEEEIADHILGQAEDQAEQDLGDEKPIAAMK